MPYSGDPSTSGLDAVRFWAQDTGTPGLLSDNEILYVINFVGLDPATAPIESAAVVADRIAAKYVGFVSITADGVSYSGDQLQLRWTTLAAALRKDAMRISAQGSTPYIGGLQFGQSFGIGMGDNPEAVRQILGNPNWNGYDGELAYPPAYDDQVGY